MELIIKHGNFGFHFFIQKDDYIILFGLDNYHNILDDIVLYNYLTFYIYMFIHKIFKLILSHFFFLIF